MMISWFTNKSDAGTRSLGIIFVMGAGVEEE
jgi:hypothetical protein